MVLEAIRTRDEALVTAELESVPVPMKAKVLITAFLFASHETPYSHPIPLKIVDVVKEHSTPSALYEIIMSFWKKRPSTAIVLIMKFLEAVKNPLNSVFLWLLSQDGWMSKSWGWEIVQTCLEKADGMKQQQTQPQKNGQENPENKGIEDAPAEEMQVDRNGESDAGNERKGMLKTIVSNVRVCYDRQTELDGYWLKEWFAMAVRKFGDTVDQLEPIESAVWVTEILDGAKEYRKQVA